MREYIDLVLCETCNGKREVFEAPGFSHLKKGEMVIVETENGQDMMNVIQSLCISIKSEELEFINEIVETSGRVKSKVIYKELEWEEED